MRIFEKLFSDKPKQRIYVLMAWTAYEGTDIYGLTTVKEAARGWLLSKSPCDGNTVEVWDIAPDGSSEQVEVVNPPEVAKLAS